MADKFYPSQENLGKDCGFWFGGTLETIGCHHPDSRLNGYTACGGKIIDFCADILDVSVTDPTVRVVRIPLDTPPEEGLLV